jgi:hypothetical protein
VIHILTSAQALAGFNLSTAEWKIIDNWWALSLNETFKNNTDLDVLKDEALRHKTFSLFRTQFFLKNLPKQVIQFIETWLIFSESLVLFQAELHKTIYDRQLGHHLQEQLADELSSGRNSKSEDIHRAAKAKLKSAGADDTMPIIVKVLEKTFELHKTRIDEGLLLEGLNNACKIDSSGPIACTLSPILGYVEDKQKQCLTPSPVHPTQETIADHLTSHFTNERLREMTCLNVKSCIEHSDAMLPLLKTRKQNTVGFFKKLSQKKIPQRRNPLTSDTNIEMYPLQKPK